MSDVDAGQVSRTLRALELLAARPVRPHELAAALDIHPRTARRLLDRLVAEGYVAAADDAPRPRYAATLKVLRLVGPALAGSDLVRVAAPFVAEVASRSGHVAHLSVPHEHGAVRVAVDGEGIAAVGDVVPLHSTATGKALAAHRPADVERLRRVRLERRTPHTIVDPVDLLVELSAVRERGYALDDREYASDLRCAAAAVFDSAATAVAAIGVSARSRSLPSRRLSGVGELVAQHARAMTSALGG
jgi:IclR family acetate operon transcriptional repressor